MSYGPDLTKESLHSILALDWQISHQESRTFLTHQRLLKGYGIVIDWQKQAITYFTPTSNKEVDIDNASQQTYFDARRLLKVEACAIDDMIRTYNSVGHYKNLNFLFQRMDQVCPFAVFALKSDGESGIAEYSYLLVEYNDHRDSLYEKLSSATTRFNGSDEFEKHRTRNKISFLAGHIGLYNKIIEVGRLRDGIGWSWDAKASFLNEDQLGELGEDIEAVPYRCLLSCDYSSFATWTLGCTGGYVAECHLLWLEHKQKHAQCRGFFNFD